MNEGTVFPTDYSIDDVLFERQKIEQDRYPDIKLVDKIILKNGPRAYKIASHWVIVNRHTGEINHHSLRLETYRKSRNGWSFDLEHSLTLEDKEDKEVTNLLQFLRVVLEKDFSEPSGSYIIIPVNKLNGDIHIEDTVFQRLLQLTQRFESSTLSALIEQLNTNEQDIRMSEETINQFLELTRKSGSNIISKLFDWLLKSDEMDQVINKLESIDAANLQKLNTAIGLSTLKNVLDIWRNNKNNDSEEFWQQVLAKNSFVFAQVFAFPVVIIKDKAYVGGKGISNTGGNIVDFLCANNLTMNTALVEIKTPRTRILGNQYRGDVYNISDELSGSVVQISNYKNILTKSYHSLVDRSDDFEVFDPKCVVILGSITEELKNRQQQKSFELFRMGLKDVQVITYDELFSKIEILINILEGNVIV